jgi:hypothetical protein
MKITRFSLTRGTLAALTFLGLAALPQAAQAQSTIFSNFGAGDTFNNATTGSVGWAVRGTTGGLYQAMAMPFTPGANFTLTSVEVAGSHVSGTNNYVFQIVNDAGGLPGTTVITSGAITTFPTNPGAIRSFLASGSVVAGTQYWLTASPGASDPRGAWRWTSPVVTGSGGYQTSPGPSWNPFDTSPNTQSAFRINGNVSAPEPGTLAFLALGGGLVLVKRRRC